ncbi:head-tail adaptor protein [Lysinibacillus sp. KCTC 33748]|uniref:phage head closure protein n=1 Tax=unclassified Lysinibacillus TaxID=2636778 RepID=UPI0009A6E047|nr:MULTISPECIES: phage head closure protein [unclassified Lysinibacillus]OXS67517.1 head-tail adaptor protein [Lysinibacillus sp. KCTC 33748]SKC14387.1 phage head-tail adaptor, putative, SPP1 family [Lysinibacillus sp. AC-3]
MPKQQANNLNKRISIWGNVEVENRLGETTNEFEEIEKIWSSIIPQTGSLQKQVVETVLTNVTHKIKVRYSAGKFISKEMQIRFKGHKFEIKYILNPYFENEWLEIFVQEVLN